MNPAISIDLAQIHWEGGGLSRFEVNGTQNVQQVLLSEPLADVAIESRASFGHDLDRNQVGIMLNTDMMVTTGKPAQPAGIAGHFELTFTFTVDNLPELLIAPDQPDSPLHPQLVLMLLSVAYSTARGILWTRLAGTPLEGITLPLINPAQLLQPAEPAVPPVLPAKKPRSSASANPKKSTPLK